jgi:hypothetical protein
MHISPLDLPFSPKGAYDFSPLDLLFSPKGADDFLLVLPQGP